MVNLLITHGVDLTRYCVPRDELEAHLLNELREALSQLEDAESRISNLEWDGNDARQTLEAIRNVLVELDLPEDSEPLSDVLRDPDTLSRLLAKAIAE